MNLNPLFELIFCSVMILRLTTQVLITTVTQILLSYAPADAPKTAKLCLLFDKLLDIV